jgi:predicted Zn-ribbon and HTH transcriptional regulator
MVHNDWRYGLVNSNKMTEQDKKQLWMEIEHIFDSGANELRVFNMVKSFIEKRYQALHIAPVVGRSEQLVCDYKYHNRDITTNGDCTKCKSHKWR